MRVQNEELWSQQAQELQVDESSRKFHDFLVFWCETADTMLDESYGILHPYDALSKAFVVAEQTFGFLSVEWLGQMLLVIVQQWFDGSKVWESLSVYERRMVEQATALKLTELQEYAKIAAGDPQDSETQN